nr:hypothetical protein [Massilia sp. JS1662]
MVGINPFYPLFSGKKFRSLRLVSWDSYKRGLNFYSLAGFSLLAVGCWMLFFGGYASSRFNALAFANLSLSVIRTLSMRKGMNVRHGEYAALGNTSWIADFEFSARFLSFGIACLIVLVEHISDYPEIAFLLAVACFFMALVPIINRLVISPRNERNG